MDIAVDQHEWECVFERRFYPNFFGTVRGLDDVWDNHVTIYKDRIARHYVPKAELKRKAQQEIGRCSDGYKQFEEEIMDTRDKYEKYATEAQDIHDSIRNRGLEDFSDKKIANIIASVEEMHVEIGATISKLQRELEDRLTEYLRESTGLHERQIINLVMPPNSSFTQKRAIAKYNIINKLLEMDELIEGIKNEIQSTLDTRLQDKLASRNVIELEAIYSISNYLYDNDKSREIILDYVQEYGSIQRDYGEEAFLHETALHGPVKGQDKSEITGEIFDDIAETLLTTNAEMQIELEIHNKNRLSKLNSMTRALAGLEKGDPEFHIADILSELNKKRYERRVTLNRIDAYVAPLFKRVVEDHASEGVDATDCRFLELPQLVDLAQGKDIDAQEIISDMKKGCVICTINGENRKLVGSQAIEIVNDLREHVPLPPEKPDGKFQKTGKLRFGTVDESKIYGKAKVVHDASDIRSKLSEGDVMVTTMIHPPHADFLDLPSAIILSEGTITCHAVTLISEAVSEPIPVITDSDWATDHIDDGDSIYIHEPTGDETAVNSMKTQFEVRP